MYVLEIPYMDLDQIYNSGQVFRWIRLRESKYVVPLRDKALKVEQQKNRIMFDCTEDAFFEIWWNYFDLQTDYSIPFYAIRRTSDDNKIAANRAKGIHILNQDLFEVIIACCLGLPFSNETVEIQRQRMFEISKRIGAKHKQAMREDGQFVWYEFPTPKKLLENIDDISDVLGKNYDLIFDLCDSIECGWFDIDLLKDLSTSDAKEYLQQFGINKQKSNAICLYGLHKLDSFPVDRCIKTIIKDNDMNLKEYYNEFISGDQIVDDNKGILRMYLWYDKLNPSMRREDWLL